MKKELTLNLKNGFELVITGDYDKHYDYEREITATFGTGGKSRLFVRKKR